VNGPGLLRREISLERLYVMRAAYALASAVTAYAVPLLVLLASGSAVLTGVAFAAEWAPRLVAFGFAGMFGRLRRALPVA